VFTARYGLRTIQVKFRLQRLNWNTSFVRTVRAVRQSINAAVEITKLPIHMSSNPHFYVLIASMTPPTAIGGLLRFDGRCDFTLETSSS
jgi:hypothetical protein